MISWLDFRGGVRLAEDGRVWFEGDRDLPGMFKPDQEGEPDRKSRPYRRKEMDERVTGGSGLQGNPAAEDGRVWFDGRHDLQVMKVGLHGSPAVGEEPPLPEERNV